MLSPQQSLEGVLETADAHRSPKFMQLFRAYPADVVSTVHSETFSSRFLPRQPRRRQQQQQQQQMRSLEISVGFADLHLRQEADGDDEDDSDDERGAGAATAAGSAARAQHKEWSGVESNQSSFFLYSWAPDRSPAAAAAAAGTGAATRRAAEKAEEADCAISQLSLRVNPLTVNSEGLTSQSSQAAAEDKGASSATATAAGGGGGGGDENVNKKLMQFNAFDIAPVALAEVQEDSTRDLIRSAIEVRPHCTLRIIIHYQALILSLLLLLWCVVRCGRIIAVSLLCLLSQSVMRDTGAVPRSGGRWQSPARSAKHQRAVTSGVEQRAAQRHMQQRQHLLRRDGAAL